MNYREEEESSRKQTNIQTKPSSCLCVCVESESEAPVVTARRPPDPGEAETGRRPGPGPGVHQVPADLRREELVAEEFGPSLPERNGPERDQSCDETTRVRHRGEETQVRLQRDFYLSFFIRDTLIHVSYVHLRLRELLEAEEQQLLQEVEEKKETTVERQAKMREKAKVLRERRESERQQLVSDKLDQLFR